MKYLNLYLKERKGKTILALSLLLGQVLGTLLIPFLVARIVNRGILKGDMDSIIAIGLQMLLAALLCSAFSIWGSWVTSDLAAGFGYGLRKRLFSRSQALSLQQFDSVGISSMITRTTSDIANLQQGLGMMLQLAIPAPIIALFSIIMTAMVSLPMAALQMVFITLLMGFYIFMLKKSKWLSKTIQTRLDKVNQVVRESITGARVIRAFGNEDYEEKRSGEAYAQYAGNMIRLNRLFAFITPAVWLLIGLMMTAVVALGGILVLKGAMEIGQIFAVAEYAILTMAYLIMAASALSTLPKIRSCMERLKEVLETDPAIPDHPKEKEGSRFESFDIPTSPAGSDGTLQVPYGTWQVPGKYPAKPGNTSGEIPAVEFDHVTFSYPGAVEAVINQLSFRLQPGTTTAVIGSTGSGKSTLADLLLRLHDIQSGHIMINGTDIRNLPLGQLRSTLSCVPQKSFLFSGTIESNLRMGRALATKEQLWEALRIAQADVFVRELPRKLKAPVSQGGVNFSGGQRQRLSIARALVQNAEILIFDDSFSALDLKTDSALRLALRQCVTAPAKLIIAQRISTIFDADQILVLNEGRLAGSGTHETLLKECAIYKAIAESQL